MEWGYLYETPANRFVAGFVGDNSVLEAQVIATDGQQCVVEAGGLRLTGLNINGASRGDTVQCSIRPERIRVADDQAAPVSQNLVDVNLKDIIYFGDHVRLRCELPGQPEITVKQALDHRHAMAMGQPVRLQIPAEHLRVYR